MKKLNLKLYAYALNLLSITGLWASDDFEKYKEFFSEVSVEDMDDFFMNLYNSQNSQSYGIIDGILGKRAEQEPIVFVQENPAKRQKKDEAYELQALSSAYEDDVSPTAIESSVDKVLSFSSMPATEDLSTATEDLARPDDLSLEAILDQWPKEDHNICKEMFDTINNINSRQDTKNILLDMMFFHKLIGFRLSGRCKMLWYEKPYFKKNYKDKNMSYFRNKLHLLRKIFEEAKEKISHQNQIEIQNDHLAEKSIISEENAPQKDCKSLEEILNVWPEKDHHICREMFDNISNRKLQKDTRKILLEMMFFHNLIGFREYANFNNTWHEENYFKENYKDKNMFYFRNKLHLLRKIFEEAKDKFATNHQQ